MPAIAMTWAVAVPLVGLILYRRVRRNFGRQPLRVGRLMLRSGLLALQPSSRVVERSGSLWQTR